MDLTKSESGHVSQNFCFSIRWDLWVMYCIPMRLGHKSPTHYYSCLGGTGTDLTKSAPGLVMPSLCFCIRWELRVRKCIPVCLRQEVDTLFFMLWSDRYRFHKNHAGTLYAKLVFLHPVGYAGHIVHSDASGSRNVNTLFTCSGGTSTDRTKAQWNMLRRICVFASNMIYGSRSALRCIPGVKHQRNIFHARVGAVQISQNALQDMLC
jgi:hypothetical protein